MEKKSPAKKRKPRSGTGGTATKNKQTRPDKVVLRRAPAQTQKVQRPTPDVVYTQPQPFNKNKFLLHAVTAVAVVMALIFGMSIFFKVDVITVSGAEKYTAWEVSQASGIQKGDNLLTISKAKVGGNILSKLPYADDVRIGIKLPDTVNIEIRELDVVYAIEASDNSWWLVSADGNAVEKTTAIQAKMRTTVLGVIIEPGQEGQRIVAAEPEPETVPSGAEGETTAPIIPVTVTASERLETFLTIAQYLESNGVLGSIASIDVTNLGQIELWYGERYQIELGDTTQLGYKISSMKKAIDQEKGYQ